MILVDTSIWIDHFRRRDERLVELLSNGQVWMHPFVLGELALGNLVPRSEIIAELKNLPQIDVATDGEVLEFIGTQNLFGLGIGYVDAHLLAAMRITPGVTLWTRDKRLGIAAAGL